ncbi:MAG TPA: gliding motility-associated C-terminal domain-containing protein, partial [Bacteroidales bacterium]|nr:gliding motility-associated C-terminal domain-containing protein [Bacteroidales bacterium]
ADHCGNLATATHLITIDDNVNPTLTAPASLTAVCDISEQPAYTTYAEFTAAGGTASDNCGIDEGSFTLLSEVSDGNTCPEVITRTYQIADHCGNLATATHLITIDDTTAPTFTVPVDTTICRDVDGNYDIDVTNTGDVTDESDNCDTSLDAIYTDSDADMGTVDTVGFITRTWTLTDDCGNFTSHDQIIWVQPVPRISVTVPDTLFCNGSTVEFAIDSLVVSKGEVMYDLDVTYPAGVPGTLTDGQRQIADISDHLVNSTDSYQTVTYHFRPYIQGKPGDPTCNEGVEVIIAIHVEPTARVDLTLTDDELCNGENVNIELSTVTTPYSGIEFNVSALNDYPEITGYTDRTGLALADLINEPLSNSGDTARLVTYVVSPVTLDVSGNQKCTGINDTVRVWVNPTPRATPVNYTPHMCYGETTDIVLLSPTVMSSGINEFNYTITSTAPTTVVAGNRDPLNGVAPGTHLQFPYTNESDTMQSVFFRITPKVTGPGCPYGPPVVSEVKVHAHPLQSLEIMDSITCDGGQDGALEILHARGIDSMWVAWTGPDYWEDAGYNMFIAEECSQGYYTATVTDSLGCVSSAWLNLLAPNTEVSFYFNPYITCPGAGDATATIALTEGNAPPYHYYLIRNYTDTVYQGSMTLGHFFNLANLSPGDYLLSVEDANGCKKELLQTLYDAPATTVKFEKSLYAEDNISCSDYHDGSIRVSKISTWYMTGSDTAFVSTRAPYSYHWTATDGGVITGNPDDSLLVDIPAGTYTLTVTDNLGCQFQFTEVMTEPDGIDLLDEDISQSPDGNYQISCHDGSDGYITLQFDGGTGAYSYEWTGPDGFTADTESLTSLGAGTYDLTVTDASLCHKSYSWTLHQPDSLSIAVNTSHTPDGAYNIGCHGDNGTIDITVTGGSGPGTYTYSWTSIEDPEWTSNLEDIDVNAGHYQLQLTDVNGCTNTRSVEMTQPEPLGLELVISEITCLNSPAYDDGAINLTVSGGKAPYTYSWTGPSGFTSSLEDISSLTEGTYSVTVTDDYGCTISTDTVLTLPEPLTIEARLSDYNGYSVSCLGRADGWIKVATLTGTAPYEYTWTGPDGFTATLTDSIYALKEGTYTVTVTDSHLCTMTQDISLASPGQLSMILSEGSSNGGSYNINCNGAATGTVIVTAVNAAGTPGYLWSDGQTGASRDNLPAGLHEVIITDANGCIADTSLTLTQPDSLRISFSIISPYCPESNDGSIFAGVTGGEGAYTFVWSDGQTTREATGLIQGLYIVEARDFNGCVIADSLQLNALNEICVGIPNAFSPDGDGINEYWNITRIAFYSEAEVIILNRWGEMVWKSERGYPEPWDGRASNGKILPMDSYHYAIDLHNGERPIVGHVTIIR